MKNVIATGIENNRPSTESFSDWLGKLNKKRSEDLFGIDKYIMSVDRDGDVIVITTFNGSRYTILDNGRNFKDLSDLIGYKVTLYPKKHEGYELEAYFLWNWDKKQESHDFGHLVVNKVLEIKRVDRDGVIIFENGDELLVPFKDYEKPYYKASKRLHGDDTYREGYTIDFDAAIQEMRDKFVGEYVVYSTRLSSLEVGGLILSVTTYRESAHKEYAEKDKFLFRWESGVIKSHASWDQYRVPIYLEDGRIMAFSYFDYSRHVNGAYNEKIVGQLKNRLSNEIGKLCRFLVVYGGDKEENHTSWDVISIVMDADGEVLVGANSPLPM